MTGFASVPKKPVPDLDARLARLQERVQHMAQDVRIGFVNDRLVVKVNGSSESLMKELRFGTSWYMPWEKIDEIVFAAVMSEPTRI